MPRARCGVCRIRPRRWRPDCPGAVQSGRLLDRKNGSRGGSCRDARPGGPSLARRGSVRVRNLSELPGCRRNSPSCTRRTPRHAARLLPTASLVQSSGPPSGRLTTGGVLSAAGEQENLGPRLHASCQILLEDRLDLACCSATSAHIVHSHVKQKIQHIPLTIYLGNVL